MPPPDKPARRFSFFGLNSNASAAVSGGAHVKTPQLKLEADKEVYRPGDLITVTIEIQNTSSSWSLLIQKLNFEIKGIEKLDTQWFNTPKPTPDYRHRRGEYVFMDSSSPTIVSNQILSSGLTRTYVVRTLLPSHIPPSYRGATIRYFYYVRTTLSGQYLILENGTSRGESREEIPELEERLPLQIWLSQKSNGMFSDEGHADDRSLATLSPSQPPRLPKTFASEDDSTIPSASAPVESGISEGFVRGRSYNIRLDDQVLLRFSPKNSESTYYFCDMIGGTLSFFHEEETRKCLELSVSLEMTETISRNYVHHSRRHTPAITKVYSDHHEVVADLVQTSFLFSIPMDGPMTFSTRYVSVQWALRFEFLTTPRNVDWTRYEHPLMVEGRDKCEWILPITVHAPPSRTTSAQKSERPVSLDSAWTRT